MERMQYLKEDAQTAYLAWNHGLLSEHEFAMRAASYIEATLKSESPETMQFAISKDET